MNLLPNQHLGTTPSFYKYKDLLSFIHRLKVDRVLEGHGGCVNSIVWDPSGTHILSGSDDQTVAITKVFLDGLESICLQETSEEGDDVIRPSDNVGKQIFKAKLNKTSNILCAKFLPFSNNTKVICGAKNGAVHYLETGQKEDFYERLLPIECHTASVYDLLTFPDAPTCFLSCSHDRTLAWFDTRQTPHRSQHCALRLLSPACALAAHPSRWHEFALGSADGFVRIYDRRKLSENGVSSDLSSSGPFVGVCRPLGLPARARPEGALMTDYGALHVTSVEYSSHDNGRYILTSHMYDSVYLYDTHQLENRPDSDFMQDLTAWDNRGRVGLRFGWSDTGPNSVAANNEPVAQNAFRSRWSRLRQSDRELANSQAFKIMSEEFVTDELTSVPRYKCLQYFTGHRNFRTVLKDASFWGDKYVMSGSECGHVFIWDRESGEIVHVLEADSRVVNRIRPHPKLPCFISSGIESNIKLFSPVSDVSRYDSKQITKIVTENEKFTNIARSTACLPFWLLVGLHRSLQGGRNPTESPHSNNPTAPPSDEA